MNKKKSNKKIFNQSIKRGKPKYNTFKKLTGYLKKNQKMWTNLHIYHENAVLTGSC